MLDFIFLHLTYPLKTVIENILGFFPHADLYLDIDSPLWYITPLLAYYILFPLIFWKRFPAVSAVGMALFGWLFIVYSPKFNIVSTDMIRMYKLHFLSFPSGMVLASAISRTPKFISNIVERSGALLKSFYLSTVLRFAALVVAGSVFAYTYFNSFVGQDWKMESAASLFTVAAIIVIFLFMKINFKILSLFGAFSFEIYLLHWPLLYRYNFLYGKIPAGAATLIYLALFLGLGYLYAGLFRRIFSPAAARLKKEETK
jgi:peptidoglycan/LPS O-acetylase OafA/YrhL